MQKHYTYDLQITLCVFFCCCFFQTADFLINRLAVVPCSLKPSGATLCCSFHLFSQVVSVYFQFRSCAAQGFSQIKYTFRCLVSTGGWVIEEETQCLLMRTLKLMCPFGSSEGDLRKIQKHSARATQPLSHRWSISIFHSARLPAIQTPEQSNAKHSSVLKFLFCAGGSGECHAVVQSAAVHFCWIPSERLARNHTVSDSEKAATEKGEPLERIYEVAYGGGRIWMQQVLTITDNWTVSSLLSFLNTSRHCFSQLAGLFCCCCFFYLQVKLKLPS